MKWRSAALAVYAAVALASIYGRTVTIDEPFHLAYSRQALLEGDFRRWTPGALVTHNSKMPVTMPNAAVSILADRAGLAADSDLRLLLERAPTLLWTLLGAVMTFLLALRLAGERAA